MVVYRGFFHRLNRFPGPFLAKFSNLYVTARIWNRMHLHEDVKKLHEKYGDVVRIALRDYEPRVLKYTNQLLAGIEASAGTRFNASLWFNFYSFDVMGEFSLGHGFRMLEDGVAHFYMDGLHNETLAVGRFTHAMWALPIYRKMSLWNAELRKFKGWISQQVQQRIQNKPESPDIFTWVLEDFESKKEHSFQDMLNLYGDCILITVAGSDTVAAVLSCLFMELARHPQEYKKLQEEVDEYFHARFFESPDEFIPERWIDRPELVKNPAVYVPFSTGHDVCIGKQLGLLETRFVVSAVVHKYNLRYAQGQTGEKFLADNKDTGTLTVGPLNLVFGPRKS
ncbi:Cytochrome P450 monooxygenase [Colletotrichum sp. SAR 10_71]|nr:Cytochrome P450 monooxygenase [Colletotrichum sp. SAR 10_71]KAI8185982.1 Cytochrome P450 monooxygenase [Colletotrichum sp. SAR 10_75]KAI8192838.1 Cytochrome P450 monooxygenase [Colletotrichum sp. SAR 10_65]